MRYKCTKHILLFDKEKYSEQKITVSCIIILKLKKSPYFYSKLRLVNTFMSALKSLCRNNGNFLRHSVEQLFAQNNVLYWAKIKKMFV